MGTHIPRDQQRRKIKEHDDMARRRRASFKQYLRDLEEELLEADMAEETDDPLIEPQDD